MAIYRVVTICRVVVSLNIAAKYCSGACWHSLFGRVVMPQAFLKTALFLLKNSFFQGVIDVVVRGF